MGARNVPKCYPHSPDVGAGVSLVAWCAVEVVLVPAVGTAAAFDVKGINALVLGAVAPGAFPNKLDWLGVLAKNDDPGVVVVVAPGVAIAAAPPNKLDVVPGELVEGTPVTGPGVADFPNILAVGAADVLGAGPPNKLGVPEAVLVVGVPADGVVGRPNKPPDDGMLLKMLEPPVLPKILEGLVDVLVAAPAAVFPTVVPNRPLPETLPWLFCGALMTIPMLAMAAMRRPQSSRLCRYVGQVRVAFPNHRPNMANYLASGGAVFTRSVASNNRCDCNEIHGRTTLYVNGPQSPAYLAVRVGAPQTAPVGTPAVQSPSPGLIFSCA